MTNAEILIGMLKHIEDPDLYDLVKAYDENKDFHFTRYKAGDYLAHMGMPIENIMLMMKGQVAVYTFSLEGTQLRRGVSEAPQIFGQYEIINGIADYSVTLQADTEVICALIPKELFMDLIRKNHEITLLSLTYLAKFTHRMLDRNDQLTLNQPFKNLLLYLIENCYGKKFPVSLSSNKQEIAQLLNISSRTMFRYLDQLENEKMISRSHGKIVISEDSYKRLLKTLPNPGDRGEKTLFENNASDASRTV